MVEKQSHGGEEDSGVRSPRVLGQTWSWGKLGYERERIGEKSHCFSMIQKSG